MTSDDSAFDQRVPPGEQPDQQVESAAQPSDPDAQDLATRIGALHAARHEVEKVIVGQSRLIERVLIALLAGGHVLIEGVPGLAKTRTVRAFSEALGGSWQRVQFTPDLVPSDLIGTRVWLPSEGRFTREIGPVATNFLLADEINRAPAKVQSALLQSMEERQVTIARETIALPDPFLVLATQNPLESEGTYPLPDAQTDRFMFRVVVTYPSFEEEMEVVRRQLVGNEPVRPALSIDDLRAVRAHVSRVYVGKEAAQAAVRLVCSTRPGGLPSGLEGRLRAGAGVRGSLNLILASQARALLHGRTEVTVGDVTDLAVDVLSHRLALSYESILDGRTQPDVMGEILARSGLIG